MPDGVEPLPIHQTLDRHFARLILGEPGEHGRGLVDGVLADPRACAVRADPGGAHDRAEIAVAAALDLAVRRLAQDREVCGEQVGAGLGEPGQAVEIRVDLLVVVPHPGDVDPGVDELRGELQLHGDAGLHVDGAAAPDERLPVLGDVAGGDVAVDRHGVDVPGDHDPLIPAEVGASHDRVAVAVDREMRRGRGGPRGSHRPAPAHRRRRSGCRRSRE